MEVQKPCQYRKQSEPRNTRNTRNRRAFWGRVWIFRVFRVFRGLKNFLGEDLGRTSALARLRFMKQDNQMKNEFVLEIRV
jgi:hypothetical protein